MSPNNEHIEKLIKAFSSDYMEKLFYFCLKKTGNTTEAEDLASDITINIISELRKGTIPTSFSAWIWRIARNRYSVWADNKHKRNEAVSGADIGELDVADEKSTEDKYLHSDDIKMLRRELAFISKDYRDVVVAFYIDDRKVQDIALSLNLPEGTVKAKLFRSRKILKEGMNMAREFGVRSYKPEEVSFIKNGNDGTDGSPWKQLETKLTKNILLEAYYNPSTIEQLSIELGVATPYMEEAVAELETVELLKKNCDKYETNFPIISRDAQFKIQIKRAEYAKEIFTHACDVIKIIEADHKENRTVLYGGYQNFEELKWYLILRLVDEADWEAYEKRYGKKKPNTKRPRGGDWDIVGFEDCPDDVRFFVGLHGCGSATDLYFDNYKILYANLLDRAGGDLIDEQAQTFAKVLNDKQSECDTEILDKLVKRGFLRFDGYKYISTLPVGKKGSSFIMQACNIKTFNKEIFPICIKMTDVLYELYGYVDNCINPEIPPRLKEQIKVTSNTFTLRSHMIKMGLDSGLLKLPENIETSTIAMAAMI